MDRRATLLMIAIIDGFTAGLMVFSFSAGFIPIVQGITAGAFTLGIVLTLIVLVDRS